MAFYFSVSVSSHDWKNILLFNLRSSTYTFAWLWYLSSFVTCTGSWMWGFYCADFSPVTPDLLLRNRKVSSFLKTCRKQRISYCVQNWLATSNQLAYRSDRFKHVRSIVKAKDVLLCRIWLCFFVGGGFMSTLDRFFVLNEKTTFALFSQKENLSYKAISNWLPKSSQNCYSFLINKHDHILEVAVWYFFVFLWNNDHDWV